MSNAQPQPQPLPLPADHDARLAQARKRAGWEIGDPSWADLILAAYLNPGPDAVRLAREMED